MNGCDLFRGLAGIVGDGYVAANGENMIDFGFEQGMHPAVLAFPGTCEEVRQIVTFANINKMPVVSVGGGTSINRVLTPFGDGIGICLKRLNRILELEPDNLSVKVEAGVLNTKLQADLKPYNLFLPVFPDFEESTIGGQVAGDFSSRKRYRYGSMSDYVLGVEFISPQGQLVKTGGKTVKNASGYDFTKMLAGSWGTLGVITSVILKLKPLPEKEVMIKREFSSISEAVQTGKKMLEARYAISSLNLIKNFGLNRYRKNDAAVTLAASLEGSREAVGCHLDRLSTFFEGSAVIIDNEADIHSFWEDYHQFRREMKGGPIGTVSFDKRLVQEIVPEVLLFETCGGGFDLDLAAGIIEFSLPNQGKEFPADFTCRWEELAKKMEGRLQLSFNHPVRQPLLEKLVAMIDPLGLMFPANGLLRGVNHG